MVRYQDSGETGMCAGNERGVSERGRRVIVGHDKSTGGGMRRYAGRSGDGASGGTSDDYVLFRFVFSPSASVSVSPVNTGRLRT
jgi:hypothetical protein